MLFIKVGFANNIFGKISQYMSVLWAGSSFGKLWPCGRYAGMCGAMTYKQDSAPNIQNQMDNIKWSNCERTNNVSIQILPSAVPVPDNTRQLMLVANVHIHWDPEYSDVKLIQTIMFMNELKKIVDEESISFRPGGGSGVSRTPENTPIPLVLCGDLNSLPDSGE